MEFPNWFNKTAKHNFEEFLIPLAGQENLTFLQLGVYTGDATVWLCENVLTASDSRLYDVDTWAGSNEDAHKDMDFDDVYNTYIDKIKDYEVNVKRSTTTDYLVSQYGLGEIFDFIYISCIFLF